MPRLPWKTRPVWALGAMSGTSLDGIDAALIQTDGREIFAFGDTCYTPYSDAHKGVLRNALGRWEGASEAARLVTQAHCDALKALSVSCDIVGFHGQTVAHDPRGRGTRQLGDGDALAQALGKPVIWDFRSADVAMGGQGAPLAPFFHHACARWAGLKAPIVFVNLGGVGNLTWVDPRIERPEIKGACLAFDTGPANAPLNDMMVQRRGLAFDRDGMLAAQGQVDEAIVERILASAYFRQRPPKSLDRDAFSWLHRATAMLDDADAAATLTACAAACVALALKACPTAPTCVYVTGGGAHNRTMMSMLRQLTTCPIHLVNTIGLDADMLEAQAFGYLAVRVARGLPTSSPQTTAVPSPVGGGKLAWPG